MHTRSIFIKPHNRVLAAYFDRQTRLAKNLRNTANFIIRNLRTGLSKAPEARMENENSVIAMVHTGISRYNENLHERIRRKLSGIGSLPCPSLCKSAMVHSLYKKDKAEYRYPDGNRWMLSYEELNAVLKETANKDYYALPSQANQQILRKVVQSWKGYFESLKAYKENPEAFTGAPKQPGYTRIPHATAVFTNQIVKTHVSRGRTYLTFPGCSLDVCVGAEASKFVKAEVKPCLGGYRVYVTFEDDMKKPGVPKNPSRILGLDPGVSNFLTGATNFPSEPFIIDGGWLKSANQGFNKSRARLLSELTRGLDSKKSVKNSRRLDALSRKRDDQFRDFFYKAAHHIVDYCADNRIEVIVYAHNIFQKQESGMGARCNQQFISIPYLKFFRILETISAKAGIPIVPAEESYTSKASLVDGDDMPVYGETEETPKFSGRRITRGQYRTKSGMILNADVNGAGNIIRKRYPEAFRDVEDYSYLAKTVTRITREQLCGVLYTEKQRRPKRGGMRPYLHHEHMAKKLEYMKLFGASSVKDKSQYVEEAKKKKAAKAA